MRDLARIVQVQPPREPVLNYADYTALTRQHELDHTDQECICPERSAVDYAVEVGALSDVLGFKPNPNPD